VRFVAKNTIEHVQYRRKMGENVEEEELVGKGQETPILPQLSGGEDEDAQESIDSDMSE
jgi:hypothetical protein